MTVRAQSVPLTHTATLPVLGIPTVFATNGRAMLDVVGESFGVWRALGVHDVDDASGDGATRSASVRIVVTRAHDDRAVAGDAAVRHRIAGGLRFAARTAGGVAACDPSRRLAVVRATAALVADRARFRSELLEAVVLAMLSCYDRHPVHAAAVALRGHALLFAAPSGTGKSTLAYACHAAGLDLLGDDHVRVQLEPQLRVWGWPTRVRLLSDAAAAMGVAGAAARQANGKHKVVVDTSAGARAHRLVAADATVCVLTRDGGPLALEPLAASAVRDALERQLAPGFDRFPDRWPAVVRALAARGGWRLNLSRDVHEAVPVVRDLLARAAPRV